MNEAKKAHDLFLEGFNCSQSVFCAFCHRFDIDETTAKQIAAGLGGGIGRQREVCGAVSAASMVLGSITAPINGEDNHSKQENYELVREFSERFKAIHQTIICRDILKIAAEKKESATPDDRTADYYKNRPCLKVVEDAATILEAMIAEKE